ncbi:DMT family transporter [Streptomyces sp. 8P21H-1]|uniref:DMT family transporter n=1 Tax=Streptomyces sp. 8P21H-1 TaxID=2737048 RepID=UPI0020C6A0F7|nr:DMT family transporter [Streptomyces sp. 8P21H-1]
MSALVLSVVLSLVSAVAYAGGAIVQERVAATTPDHAYAPMRRPVWWAAVGLNALGALLHVVALAYGPLSLVQPLGALTIVFALPMAAVFVRRRAGATAWRGAIMATVGLAGLLALVGTADSQSLSGTQRAVVGLVTGGAVVALMTAARAAHRHPAVRSVLLAVAAGVAFGMSSVFTKTVAVDWTGGVVLADLPSLAVIGVLATAGMLLSQASYRGAGLAAPLATLTVVNPIVAAAVGLTMFGETFRYGTTGTVLALGCGVVAAGGLILLTTERLGGTERPDGTERTRPVPPAAGTASPAAAPVEAAPSPFVAGKAAVLPGQGGPVSVRRGISSEARERVVAAAGARGETFTGAAAREVAHSFAGGIDETVPASADPPRVPGEALATAAGPFASGRTAAPVPPLGSNGPPPSGSQGPGPRPSGEVPGGPDGPGGPGGAPWLRGASYGILYPPLLLPAPVGTHSCVRA